jgi:hypothetical protein
VGLPRLSRISRATTFTIAVIFSLRCRWAAAGSYVIQAMGERLTKPSGTGVGPALLRSRLHN